MTEQVLLKDSPERIDLANEWWDHFQDWTLAPSLSTAVSWLAEHGYEVSQRKVLLP